MKLVYNGIVKNEEKALPRLIDSIREIVRDYVVVDTGSDDGTPGYLQTQNIVPYHRDFVNFEQARNAALQLAKEICEEDDYLLLLDADMVLCVLDRDALFAFLRDELPDIVYLTQKNSNLTYVNVRIVRAGLPNTCYVGATHEYLSHPSTAKVVSLPEAVAYIDDRGDGGSRGDKLVRDRRLLESAEQTPRTLFYLAQTYRESGLHDLAIETYKKRIAAGDWIEEVVYSRYCLIRLYLEVTKEEAKAVEQAEAILASGRHRPEPFYLLCTYFRGQNRIPDAVKYLTAAQMSLGAVKANLPLF